MFTIVTLSTVTLDPFLRGSLSPLLESPAPKTPSPTQNNRESFGNGPHDRGLPAVLGNLGGHESRSQLKTAVDPTIIWHLPHLGILPYQLSK